MPLPAIVIGQLSSIGVGLLTDLLGGLFGGLFGGDPAPDLPSELRWAETLFMGQTFYQPPGEFRKMGGIVSQLYHTGGPAILVESGLAFTGKGIEDRSSGLIVGTWDKTNGVKEILGYTAEGYPIHGAVPGNAIYHGESIPLFIPEAGHRPLNAIKVMKSGWHGNYIEGKRYGMRVGTITSLNIKLPVWQSKASSNASKIFGGTPPVSPPSGGGRGSSSGGTSSTRGGGSSRSVATRTLSASRMGPRASTEALSGSPILLLGVALVAVVIWRMNK